MGVGQHCLASTFPQDDRVKGAFDYVFGEDNFEKDVTHKDDITCRNKQIEASLKDCEDRLKLSHKLFQDPLMKIDPVILKSISGDDYEIKCTYERPYKFLQDPTTGKGRKYKIIDSDSKSSHILVRDQILQYFGVFLCFLAQNPNLISEIVLTEPNNYGIHALQMYYGTKKEYIFIDDYILCNNKTPLFCQPTKGIYMWPCLLEKAWFKLKGNISRKIEKTTPEDVLQAFLPYPIKKYRLNTEDHAYNRTLLQTHLYTLEHNKGYMVTSKREPKHKIGLSGRKFYYLLKTFEFQGKMVYYLRNPCGLFDLRGTYRFVPNQLRDLLRTVTGQLSTAQGNFVIDEQQFIQQIESFDIIYYSKSSPLVSEQRISIDFNEEMLIQTEFKNDGLVSMVLQQSGQRKQDGEHFTPITYQVFSLSDSQIVGGTRNEEGCFGVRNTHLLDAPLLKLKAGEYIIRIKKKGGVKLARTEDEWNKDRIIVTAPVKVKFDYKRTSVFDEQFRNCLKTQGQRHLKHDPNRKTKADIDHRVFWICDLAVIYILKLNTHKEEMRVEVSFPELKNLECLTHKLAPFTTLSFTEDLLIIFEKIDLTEETSLGKYVIQTY